MPINLPVVEKRGAVVERERPERAPAPSLDTLIVHIGGRLREHRIDPSIADGLRDHPVLYEVVGKWPPGAPLRATPADVGVAIIAVRKAHVALTRTSPGDPAAGALHTILQRLNESTERGLLSEPSSGAARPDEEGDADAEVVGPWPPE